MREKKQCFVIEFISEFIQALRYLMFTLALHQHIVGANKQYKRFYNVIINSFPQQKIHT